MSHGLLNNYLISFKWQLHTLFCWVRPSKLPLSLHHFLTHKSLYTHTQDNLRLVQLQSPPLMYTSLGWQVTTTRFQYIWGNYKRRRLGKLLMRLVCTHKQYVSHKPRHVGECVWVQPHMSSLTMGYGYSWSMLPGWVFMVLRMLLQPITLWQWNCGT